MGSLDKGSIRSIYLPKYIIYFNQQWVGDHPATWYNSRGPLARKVVEDMKNAGVLVFAGGLVEEIGIACGWPQEIRRFKGD
jgi:hypothetical protein